jgi:hypothetical protein
MTVEKPTPDSATFNFVSGSVNEGAADVVIRAYPGIKLTLSSKSVSDITNTLLRAEQAVTDGISKENQIVLDPPTRKFVEEEVGKLKANSTSLTSEEQKRCDVMERYLNGPVATPAPKPKT